MTRWALFKIPWDFKTVKGEPQGFFELVQTWEGESPTLQELQDIVGGLIQPVQVDTRWRNRLELRVNSELDLLGDSTGNYFLFQDLYANEEGLMMELPFNAPASAVVDQFIVGDVAVVFRDDT